MRGFASRLLLLIAALAFVAGTPLAFAVSPAPAVEPCSHEHQQPMTDAGHHQHHAPQKQQHHHDAVACLCCCVGACVAIPDLARTSVLATPSAMAAVTYLDTATALDGRSLRPEPAPPRTNAPS